MSTTLGAYLLYLFVALLLLTVALSVAKRRDVGWVKNMDGFTASILGRLVGVALIAVFVLITKRA